MSANAPVQLYSTGPAHIFVARYASISGPAAGPYYFGTAKLSPDIQIKREWEGVPNDIGGKVPVDMAFEGESALTTVEFTRWSEPVYALLASQPFNLLNAEPRGSNGGLDEGTLMLTEGLNFVFYVLFPFSYLKPSYKNLPQGYRFPGSILLGPDRHPRMGTKPKELFLVFYHLRLYDPLTGRKLLYDSDMSAVKSLPLI